MESVSDYYLFWALYLLAGIAGFWCWGKMAFWVQNRGVLYHLYSAIGAVLIFTPVVVPESDAYLAPGFIAVAFTLISSGPAALTVFAPWYAAAAVLALVVTVAGLFAGLSTVTVLSTKNTQTAERADTGPARAAKPATGKPAPVKGNPFR